MGGKTEFLERRNRARQHAQRERQVTAPVIERTTKARESLDLEREVSVPRLFQLADSRLAGERTGQLIHRVARRDGRFFDRNEYPGDAHAGQTVRCDEQVGRTLVERDVDQARDVPREPCGRCHPAPNFIRTVDFLAAMAAVQKSTLILSTSQTAVHQWHHEILDKSDLDDTLIGEYTGSSKELRPVTIATYQIVTYRPSKPPRRSSAVPNVEEDLGALVEGEPPEAWIDAGTEPSPAAWHSPLEQVFLETLPTCTGGPGSRTRLSPTV